jgi:putative peptidoglycan lipid II flippase
LVLQQLSLLVISWSAQQTGDQGALTRFTWANAIYLLPYAVLVAPLLQLIFPRLTTAAEEGAAAVASVLGEIGPQVVLLASLGASLLVATAVPVARVFVLGPGSGDTAALAWPIATFAPAVIGFGLLGLCSRTLLAQHRARAAGAVLITAWGVVILAVLGLRLVVPAAWQVSALAGSVSLGMGTGAAVGAALARPMSWLGRSVIVGLVAAAAAGGLAAWPASLFRDSGLFTATAAAFATAALCLLIFVGVLYVLDRRRLAELWTLVAGRRAAAARS